MNERIKELIAQASSWVEVDCDHGTDSEYQLDAEKFAELIVRECIKLNGKELAMPGHSRMVDVYCEHFGIEL